MSAHPSETPHPFDEVSFQTGPSAAVSFSCFSQYGWSNRFYAVLACRYGPKRGWVLEVGCGLGHLWGWLSDQYQIFGTDINTWELLQARRYDPHGNFALLSCSDGHWDALYLPVIPAIFHKLIFGARRACKRFSDRVSFLFVWVKV